MFEFPYFDLPQIFSWEFVSRGWDNFVLAWAWIGDTGIWATLGLWNLYISLSSGMIDLTGSGLQFMWYPEAGYFAIPALGQVTALIASIFLLLIAVAILAILCILFIGLVVVVWLGALCAVVLWGIVWFAWFICGTIIAWMGAPFWNIMVFLVILCTTFILAVMAISIIFLAPAAIVGALIRWMYDHSTLGRFLSIICWGAYALALQEYFSPLFMTVYFILAAGFYLDRPNKK